MTEAAADRTAAFEGRQVEQGSKVFHAGCLTVQGCVAHAVQKGRACVWVGRIERREKGFIHRGVQYIFCKKKQQQNLRVSGLTFFFFL